MRFDRVAPCDATAVEATLSDFLLVLLKDLLSPYDAICWSWIALALILGERSASVESSLLVGSELRL